MKRIALSLMASLALVLASLSVAHATTPPPGNDGGFCHGANMESCRPDPQPSNGQDCAPHGNNPDGNDDHCASPSPTEEPSSEPSTTPSVAPSTEPSVEPSLTPSVEPSVAPSSEPSSSSGPSKSPELKTPTATMPPTDTAEAPAKTSDNARLTFLGLAFVLGFFVMATLRPRRR